LEETFEILTWAQLGLHRKPCGVLNVAGFYDKLTAFLDYAVDEHFIKSEHRAMLVVDENADALIARLKTHRMPAVSKWIGRAQT
jgi:predicted Rossmann-fold nucleotide-binding protein